MTQTEKRKKTTLKDILRVSTIPCACVLDFVHIQLYKPPRPRSDPCPTLQSSTPPIRSRPRKAPTFRPPMSSSMLGGFSVSVSDADSEDLAGRIRVRSRRKRRRPESRLRRAVARWWPLALFFPALALLIYQASKIGAKPAAPSLDLVVEDAAVSREESPGNFDRLGARTRVVNGVRERT